MFFAPLDPAEIIWVQIRFLRELFLRQKEPFPLLADCCPKNDAIIK
jgi:hypothetical protein